MTQRIQQATFTGKGDKPRVIDLYKDYVGRIVTTLQSTLALAGANTTRESPFLQGPALPHVAAWDDVCVHAPLRLAEGQSLLLSEEDKLRFGVVDETGQHIALLMGGAAAVEYDRFSQVVVPWQPLHYPLARPYHPQQRRRRWLPV